MSFKNPTDGAESYLAQQENELEALASIFGDDFEDIRKKQPWKVLFPAVTCYRVFQLCHCGFIF